MDDTKTYLSQFEPERDSSGWVSEDPNVYAERMQKRFLPYWPTEVLVDWFYRHAGNIYKYAFLRFERFRFSKQKWPLDKIPGREAFDKLEFCDNFKDIKSRAENPHDWLAKYMLEHGTWNIPIIMLENNEHIIAPNRAVLKRPYHLLEGHRRLSFLNGLRALNLAKDHHYLWIVTLTKDVETT